MKICNYLQENITCFNAPLVENGGFPGLLYLNTKLIKSSGLYLFDSSFPKSARFAWPGENLFSPE